MAIQTQMELTEPKTQNNLLSQFVQLVIHRAYINSWQNQLQQKKIVYKKMNKLKEHKTTALHFIHI